MDCVNCDAELVCVGCGDWKIDNAVCETEGCTETAVYCEDCMIVYK